jgi:hypothetical protein
MRGGRYEFTVAMTHVQLQLLLEISVWFKLVGFLPHRPYARVRIIHLSNRLVIAWW